MRRISSIFSQEEKVSWFIFITSFTVYAIISMTKNAYSASIASIVAENIFTKSQAGVINSGFYLFYGAGQLVFFKQIEKFSASKYVIITLLSTIVCILGMAVFNNFFCMLFFWCLCGLIQFAIWPVMLRIVSEYVLPEHKTKAMTLISFSYCTGALFNYLLAAIVLKVSGWQTLFFVSAFILAVCLVLWIIIFRSLQKPLDKIKKINTEIIKQQLEKTTQTNNSKSDNTFFKLLLSSGVLLLLMSAFLRNFLDFGLKTWIPTMIVESYEGVSTSFANMLTTILIFINLGGVFFANFLYPKRIKNCVAAYGVTFLISVPATVMLLATGKIDVLVVVLLLSLITTMMYSGHQFQNVLIPSYFAKYNSVGSVAALLNAVASFGIVVSGIVFGVLAENFGWIGTIISWIVISIVATVFTFAAAPLWKRFTSK